MSGRNTWGIYKISVGTGHVMWQVGARGDPRLRRPWCYQHDIVALGDGRYSLFDDGGIGPGCAFKSTWHQARGLVFSVDPSKHPVQLRLVQSYTHSPPIYSEYTGSMQRLPGGQVLIDWGTTPGVTQFDPSGRQILQDLALSRWSYRGRVPKRGFETHIFLSHRYGRLAVQALSRSGKVLATSKPIRPTGG